MNIRSYDKLANQLVKAFLKDRIIKALPTTLTKKIVSANKFRKLCESKINDPIIGFKAGGTGIPLLKKEESLTSSPLSLINSKSRGTYCPRFSMTSICFSDGKSFFNACENTELRKRKATKGIILLIFIQKNFLRFFYRNLIRILSTLF